MLRVLVMASLLATAPVVPMLPQQAALAQGQSQCDTPAKKAKRSLFGNIVGNIAGNLADRAGVGSVAGVSLPVGSLLSDAIINLLNCKEQQQAANATNEAIRGGVGTESSWQSETRPNVHGSSKVTGQEQTANGGDCLTVTDVVIVDGEETTVPKKMCRSPGQSGYVKV
jgi:hypothetical protein